VRTCAHAAFGADLEEVRAETKLLCTGATEKDRARRLKYSGIYLTTVGLLRGESDWTRKIIEEFQVGEEDLWPEKHVILAEGNLRDALGAIPENDEIGGRLRAIVRFALGEQDASFDDALLAARTLLARPLLRLEDLLLFRAVAILAKEGSARDNSFAGALRDELRNDLMRALEWLAERSLVPYMEPLIDAHGDLLPKKELERWRGHLATVGRKRYDKKGEDRTHLRLSMLGAITVGAPGEEPQRIRGARLRTMLGLLVANRMLDKPLGHREFCQLAAGGELDPELARKTTNQAVLRLRESIGADTVVTGTETHELNLDRVRVDLLEADRLLREAIAAERERALIRAVPALMEALELTHGEVPFPGLYDDFFEALRSDFEHRLRSAVIGVARELLREGDPVSAERVLRGAFEAMPEDEELTDLLCDTLAALGERAEAERIRMRAREAQEA
jgi:DNA-binding SARP family transcriptional activator